MWIIRWHRVRHEVRKAPDLRQFPGIRPMASGSSLLAGPCSPVPAPQASNGFSAREDDTTRSPPGIHPDTRKPQGSAGPSTRKRKQVPGFWCANGGQPRGR